MLIKDIRREMLLLRCSFGELNPGEIGDLEEKVFDFTQQCKPVVFQLFVLVHNHDIIEKVVDRLFEAFNAV